MKFDLTTGLATSVGPFGFGGLPALAFDSDGNLFGAEGGDNKLVKINTTTNAGTLVGELGFAGVLGLAFSPNGSLFGADSGGKDKLLQRAVAMLLESIYEQVYSDCSYGFRPGRSVHKELQWLRNSRPASRRAKAAALI